MCTLKGAKYIFMRLQNDLKNSSNASKIRLDVCACQGKCEESPVININDQLFTRINPAKASELLKKYL